MNNKPFNIVNIILIIAVAVLYYLHFSSNDCKKPEEIAENDSASVATPIANNNIDLSGKQIVYVNSDVINEQYQLIKDIAATTLAEQQRLEMRYQKEGQQLQQDFAVYQQKVSQGLLTTTQAMADQENLKKRRDDLERMEIRLQELINEIQSKSEQAHKTVVNYIKEYNEKSGHNFVLAYTEMGAGALLVANDSLDITAKIVDGLNTQYKLEKEAKNKSKK